MGLDSAILFALLPRSPTKLQKCASMYVQLHSLVAVILAMLGQPLENATQLAKHQALIETSIIAAHASQLAHLAVYARHMLTQQPSLVRLSVPTIHKSYTRMTPRRPVLPPVQVVSTRMLPLKAVYHHAHFSTRQQVLVFRNVRLMVPTSCMPAIFRQILA